jgi:hypothetical protein
LYGLEHQRGALDPVQAQRELTGSVPIRPVDEALARELAPGNQARAGAAPRS